MTQLHLLWLDFLSWSVVGYLEGPGFYGGAIPFVVSIFLFCMAIRKGKTAGRIFLWCVLVGWLLCVLIGFDVDHWSAIGLHIFPVQMVIWPTMAFLFRSPLLVLLAYPLSFTSLLPVDVWCAGIEGHWQTGYWMGVGGAGLQDGLFLYPLLSTGLSAAMFAVGMWLHKRFGLFSS